MKEELKKVQASLRTIDREIAEIRNVLKKVPPNNPIGEYEPPVPPIIFGIICNPKNDDVPARAINVGDLKQAVGYLDRLNSSIKEVLDAPKPPTK